VEVVLAMAIAILAVVGLAQIATKSTSNAGSSSRRAVATTYAVAGMEWIRNQKNTIAWSDFSSTSKAPVPPNPANVYCLNSFPGSWTSMAAGACASGSTISGTEFSRSMTLSAVTSSILRRSSSLLCVPTWPGTNATGIFGMPRPTDIATACRRKPSHVSDDVG